jgi:hypothetical protein
MHEGMGGDGIGEDDGDASHVGGIGGQIPEPSLGEDWEWGL